MSRQQHSSILADDVPPARRALVVDLVALLRRAAA